MDSAETSEPKQSAEPLPRTEFQRWLWLMHYSYEDAAAILGVSRSQIANWAIGRDRARPERAALPPICVRVQMMALYRSQIIEPWPV